mgnify:CR=1 FL=1|tara:strand:- start:56 stop:331 length:276 start_codon:yes stop_codon:yes gene_type:complete
MGDSISKWNLMEEEKQPISLDRDIINGFETDLIVSKVIRKFAERSEVGIKKYNTTLGENSDGLLKFLTHLQEELMDATLYVEKIKSIIDGK